MRDAKIFQIFSGTNQIQRWTIAKSLAGKDPLVRNGVTADAKASQAFDQVSP